MAKWYPSGRNLAMMADPEKPLIYREFLAIIAVCGVLLIATLIAVANPLWSIPAIILFALTGLTLLCVLPFVGGLGLISTPRPMS
jgi:hypothetical protein